MVPQTQITEVKAELDYAVAHQCGPTYTGPTGGYWFEDGLLSDPVPGYRLLQNSMAIITHFWEVQPGYELAWQDGFWVYAPAVNRYNAKGYKEALKAEYGDEYADSAVKPMAKAKPKKKGRKSKKGKRG